MCNALQLLKLCVCVCVSLYISVLIQHAAGGVSYLLYARVRSKLKAGGQMAILYGLLAYFPPEQHKQQ